MAKCIFCENALDATTKPEHVLLSALGGRKTTKDSICSDHNNLFGSTIDKVLAEQVPAIRNLLQLDSGARKPPPSLRNLPSKDGPLTIDSGGELSLKLKPFEIKELPDGNKQVEIRVSSIEEIARHLPNIAAALGVSEQQVAEMMKTSTGSKGSFRPQTKIELSFGGPDAIRSLAKSCLVLWGLTVGNDEVRSPPYEEIRNFVLNGDSNFVESRTHLDGRLVPNAELIEAKFGPFFNLIYVRSDERGRVFAHFTLYNIIGWQLVLAEGGGSPNRSALLISNPLEPSRWTIDPSELQIGFVWLENPDFADGFKRGRETLAKVMEHHFEQRRPEVIRQIVDEVAAKYGFSEHEPVVDEATKEKMIGEISHRVAAQLMGLPIEEELDPQEIVEILRSIRLPNNDGC